MWTDDNWTGKLGHEKKRFYLNFNVFNGFLREEKKKT